MRRDYLAPRREPGEGLTLDSLHPAALRPGLLGELDAQHVLGEPIDLASLIRRADRLEQQLRRVERPVGRVGGERLLVRPVVAHVAQLARRGCAPPARVWCGTPRSSAHITPRSEEVSQAILPSPSRSIS